MKWKPRIVVTDVDESRLLRMIETYRDKRDGALAQELEAELANAEVVRSQAVPPHVVTMNSVVVYKDLDTGTLTTVELVYPSEARILNGRVSVLAPVGSALLGLSVGQSIEWPMPSGHQKRICVVRIPYQPESARVEKERRGEA